MSRKCSCVTWSDLYFKKDWSDCCIEIDGVGTENSYRESIYVAIAAILKGDNGNLDNLSFCGGSGNGEKWTDFKDI